MIVSPAAERGVPTSVGWSLADVSARLSLASLASREVCVAEGCSLTPEGTKADVSAFIGVRDGDGGGKDRNVCNTLNA